MNLKFLSDKELLLKTKEVVAKEKRITLLVLEHLIGFATEKDTSCISVKNCYVNRGESAGPLILYCPYYALPELWSSLGFDAHILSDFFSRQIFCRNQFFGWIFTLVVRNKTIAATIENDFLTGANLRSNYSV